MKKLDDLEIDQNLAFERHEWKAQRIAWLLMMALVLLSLLGLTGGGMLSHRRDRSVGGALLLEYDAFLRRESDAHFIVAAGPQPGRDTLRIWLDRRQLQQMEIEGVTPEPAGQAFLGDRVVFSFVRADPASAARIRFDVRAKNMGPLRGRVGIAGTSESLPFTQFVYP